MNCMSVLNVIEAATGEQPMQHESYNPNGRIHFSRIIAKEFVETSKYPKVIDEKFYRLLAA